MKSLIYLFIISILITNSSWVQAQKDIADERAEQMLKEFYTAYNTAWSIIAAPGIHEKKLDSLQRKYCTVRLRKEVKEVGLDHDPLIGDEYTDVGHLKTLAITKDTIKANTYIVSYIAPTTDSSNKAINITVVIHVTVKKEKEEYKIDSVW